MTVLTTDPSSPSIDIVEAGLNFAGVEEESCRWPPILESSVNNKISIGLYFSCLRTLVTYKRSKLQIIISTTEQFTLKLAKHVYRTLLMITVVFHSRVKRMIQPIHWKFFFCEGKQFSKFCALCCSRLRTVCEVEQAAVNNPFARFAINTIKWAMTISTMVTIFFSSSVRTSPACRSTRPRWTPAWVDRTALSSTRSARSPTQEPSPPSSRSFN